MTLIGSFPPLGLSCRPTAAFGEETSSIVSGQKPKTAGEPIKEDVSSLVETITACKLAGNKKKGNPASVKTGGESPTERKKENLLMMEIIF